MHLFTAASLKNRALIALVTIVTAVFGLLSVGSLKQELMPSVQFPTIAVITTYPGASPEVVNNDVSEPIETALRGVPQLETTTATSSTGASTVLAQFTYGVDVPATEQKVERAISRIADMLPETADSQVMSGSLDDFPVIQVAVTPAEGSSTEEAGELIERVAIPKLSDVEGVREAQLIGARGDRITVTPDAGLLAENGLSAQSITDTLQQSGVLMAAGTVPDGERTLAVQAGSELHSAEDIAALPIARGADALGGQETELPGELLLQDPLAEQPAAPATVTIGQVANVVLEQNPVQSISRVNGQDALTIAVTKTSAANTVDVSHGVEAELAELEDSLGGAELSVIFDQAPYVEQSIETLTTEGLLGLVFAVLVILVFLMSMRATLVTAISIPTSVLLTIIGLNFADYTLNMLTLGALTISIGRVVDDSIVVIENIKRHLSDGVDRGATIVSAVREVAGAITASTVTTVAVFLPMAFVDGMVGELFRPFSFTVSIALAASLLVSLTIVPVLAYWFLKPDSYSRRPGFLKRKGVDSIDEHDPDRVTALQRGYRPIIDWTLRRPAVTLIIAALVFGGTIAASSLMKTNYMGADEQNSVGLTQTLAPGTSLDAQLAQAEKVEGALADIDAVDTVQVTIGGGDGVQSLFGGGGDGTVSYSITTDPDAVQSEVQDRIRDAVDALEDAGDFSLGASDGGVTMSSAIEVYVTAPDQETLAAASEAVVAELSEQNGLIQVESDLGTSRPFLSIAVDRMLAADAGLSEAAVAGLVAQRMQPSQIGQITMEENTVEVYLSEGARPADQAGVAALPIPTPTGEQRLDSLATIQVADGPVTVRTENGVRMVTVSALPEGDDLGTAGTAVSGALDSAELPAGANASIGGVMSQQEEAFGQLGIALLAAILIVYVVMVATFKSLLQPLLLLISVPFAATGAILLLIVTGIPLGVASLIGVLMLIGIVVTNAIVLVDLVNQFRARGETLHHAVVHGSLLRLRPIVMTALATILALTPMGLGITGKGGFISQPLAVVVIGGLLSSTVLTLVVLPTLYYLVERRREIWRERRGRRRPEGALPGGAAPAAAGVGEVDRRPGEAAAEADADSRSLRRRSGARRRREAATSAAPGAGVGAGVSVGAVGAGLAATLPEHAGGEQGVVETEGDHGVVEPGGASPSGSEEHRAEHAGSAESAGADDRDGHAERAGEHGDRGSALEQAEPEGAISPELAELLGEMGLPAAHAWESGAGPARVPVFRSVEEGASDSTDGRAFDETEESEKVAEPSTDATLAPVSEQTAAQDPHLEPASTIESEPDLPEPQPSEPEPEQQPEPEPDDDHEDAAPTLEELFGITEHGEDEEGPDVAEELNWDQLIYQAVQEAEPGGQGSAGDGSPAARDADPAEDAAADPESER